MGLNGFSVSEAISKTFIHQAATDGRTQNCFELFVEVSVLILGEHKIETGKKRFCM